MILFQCFSILKFHGLNTYMIYKTVLKIVMYISVLEPQCIGEYEIDISPSQNDEECKNKEIITATVDKVNGYMFDIKFCF